MHSLVESSVKHCYFVTEYDIKTYQHLEHQENISLPPLRQPDLGDCAKVPKQRGTQYPQSVKESIMFTSSTVSVIKTGLE
jgi:hypothetical protein